MWRPAYRTQKAGHRTFSASTKPDGNLYHCRVKTVAVIFKLFFSRRYDDVFEESMAKFYLAEMVLAVRALHTMGYVHRLVTQQL